MRKRLLLLSLATLLAATCATPVSARARPPTTPLTASTFSQADLTSAISAHSVKSALADTKLGTLVLHLRDGRTADMPLPSHQRLLALSMSGANVQLARQQGGTPIATILTICIGSMVLLLLLAMVAGPRVRRRRLLRGKKASGLRKEVAVDGPPPVHFSDVAGIDEAIEELQEVLDFLHNPEKYHRLGARMPSSVLLYGPPGTGKTLLAKALAGEAGVPFFAVSGSEFVELYVGVGAMRIRELFQRARKSKEGAVIFIDEIDALGRTRVGGDQVAHEERDQTLNQLLVELDGFATVTHVAVVAATNRLDILDPALLRPGRFGRQVAIDYPSEEGRLAILKVHASGKPLDETVDMRELAKTTSGLSGAHLAEIINEAALMAARQNRETITKPDFDEAQLRILAGPEKRSSALAEGELEIVAYHEAGHVLAAELCPHHEKASRATVRPRGRAAGLTLYPRGDRSLTNSHHIHEEMACALAGRAAEQIVFGRISSGAANDLVLVNNLSRQAIKEFGLSAEMGHLSGGHELSDETMGRIDREVERAVNEAYRDALRLLEAHRPQLDALATLLASQGDLERVDILAAIEGITAQELQPSLGPSPQKSPQRMTAKKTHIIQNPFRQPGLRARLAHWIAGEDYTTR